MRRRSVLASTAGPEFLRAATLIVVAASLAACGDGDDSGRHDAGTGDGAALDGGGGLDGNPGVDAGADAGADDDAGQADDDCPDGWRSGLTPGGVEYCEPWPESSPVEWTCPDGWARTTDVLPSCEPWPGASPIRWPCPAGWTPRADEGTPYCEPLPEDAPPTCDAVSLIVPGASDCRRVGSDCNQDAFPEDAFVVRVLAGETGGDGSEARPYGSLEDVPFDSLPPGAVVALGPGRYQGNLVLTSSVSLWGACPEETVIESEPGVSELTSTLRIEGNGSVTVRDLRFTEGDGPAVVVDGDSARLTVRDTIIERPRRAAIVALNLSRLDVIDVLSRDTRAGATGDASHIIVEDGSRARIRRVLLEGGFAGLTLVDDETEVTIEDLIARRMDNYGLGVGPGARVVAQRVALFDNRAIAIQILGPSSELLVEDAILRRTRGRLGTQDDGAGIAVTEDARATFRRVLIDENRKIGVGVSRPGAVARLEDCIIRDTRAQEVTLALGTGASVSGGARMELRRVLFTRNRNIGIGVSTSAEIDAEDVIIRDTRETRDDGTFGVGIDANTGALVSARRLFIEDNRTYGVLARGALTEVGIEDFIIRGTRPADRAPEAAGAVVADAALLSLARGTLNDNTNIGAFALAAGELEMEHVAVLDTEPGEVNRGHGVGVVAGTGAVVELRNVELARNTAAAVFASEPTTRVTIERARFLDTGVDPRSVVRGRGLALESGAQASARELHVVGHRQAGVSADGDFSRVELDRVVISGVQSDVVTGVGGYGLIVQGGAEAEVSGSSILDVQGFGLLGVDAQATLDAVIVDGVTLPDCALRDESCADQASAVGATRSSLRIDDGRLLRAERCGVFVGEASEADVVGGRIESNRFGACIQSEGFDASRISGDGAILGNEEAELTETDWPEPERLPSFSDG